MKCFFPAPLSSNSPKNPSNTVSMLHTPRPNPHWLHQMESGVLFPLLSLVCLFLSPTVAHQLRTYIVQVHPDLVGPGRGTHAGTNAGSSKRLDFHLSLLSQSIDPELQKDPSTRMLYSYDSAIEGFSARLSDDEVALLRRTHGVIAVRPDTRIQLRTTYSYKFLGLQGATHGRPSWAQPNYGHGSVIGVLDTGVWPESPSFDDRHMPPVPRRWRGTCQGGANFPPSLCNRKLIGARFYPHGHRAGAGAGEAEYNSARDAHGHGTHTSSTAAGAAVPGASVLGNAAGEARGVAPGAHVAVYKVCWYEGCYSSDILAAIDDAIRDGVDVLSLSLGGFPLPFYDDNIAIGGFRAAAKGVSVVCAAGNNGPIPSSVANEAPWVTTVGASTLDRTFPALVRLGDGQILSGQSMYPGNRPGRALPELEVVYENDSGNGGERCLNGSLPRAGVAKKIVVCDRGTTGRASKGEVVKESGGAAMILANAAINGDEDSVDVHVLPATQISYADSLRLKRYLHSTTKPKAKIEFKGTVMGRTRAPRVAVFSSRGPSLTNPTILKPDIVAPGVNIVAAWPANLGPTGLPEDKRRVSFTVLSGTSMACPHVSGATAVVRAAHPRWSPAAVRSAIMTTADALDHSGEWISDAGRPAKVFAVGAGHLNPVRAVDPGLVYDTKPDEYVTHLCTLGYENSDVFTITSRNVSCRELLAKYRDFSLNYPSISVVFKKGKEIQMVRRRVTNVGRPNSTYTVEVAAPPGVRMSVRPPSLTFNGLYQSKVYSVWFVSRKRASDGFSEGHITWVDGRHRVRSPVSVTWQG